MEKRGNNMELINGIKERRSVRKYSDEVISHEVIEEIIGTAAYAPSWKNSQTVRYIIVETEDMKKKIAEECVLGFEYNTKTLLGADKIVLVTTVTGRCGYEKDGSFSTSKGSGWEMFDAGVAAQTFCLAAHEKGVGTVIMGIFDENKLAEGAGIPEGQVVSAIISMGYPKFVPETPARKSVEELVSYK